MNLTDLKNLNTISFYGDPVKVLQKNGTAIWSIIDGDAANFTFRGNECTGYVGDCIRIAIPSNYSINDTNYTVTHIDFTAFQGYTHLKSITIPDSVTYIGYAVFKHTGITDITIPNSVTTIGAEAFSYCGITDVIIPSNVTSIGRNPFYACQNLNSIMVEADNTVYTSRDGSGNECNIIASKTGELKSGCINSVIPSNITSLGEYAFGGCMLESITIPSNVTKIGDAAFCKCTNLKTVKIQEGVQSIGNNAFRECKPNLTKITLPSSITSIGSYAFYECSFLTSVTLLSETPPTLASTNAFSKVNSSFEIKVPSASLNAYKTATNWSTYASKMVGV